MPSRISAHSRLALLLACGLLPACSQANATASAPAPTPIKVQRIERSEQLTLARFSASIEPTTRVNLAFRVGGYLQELGQVALPRGQRRALDKGDFVKRGTLLARIRSDDYAQKVATARALTAEARSQEKLARLELERAQRLLDTEAITKAEYDSKAAHAEWAVANTEGAEARQAEAEVALGDTVLRAPFDGVILSRPAEVGALVGPGQETVTMADTRRVKAVFGVPQRLVQELAIGSAVQVFVDADAGMTDDEGRREVARERRLDAHVTRIAPSADSLGRVFSVEALLDNPGFKLRPGSVASVHLPGLTRESAPIAIPLAAVVRSPARTNAFSVFVLEGESDRGPVRLRAVELGEVLGNSVSVLDGLALGQRVVTVGSTLLRDGGDAVVIR